MPKPEAQLIHQTKNIEINKNIYVIYLIQFGDVEWCVAESRDARAPIGNVNAQIIM